MEIPQKTYKGLVAFDIDNTLLDHHTWKITPSAMDAIGQLRKNGWCIAIATGRDMRNKNSIAYLEQVSPDGLIHMNGTKVEAGDQVLIDHLMDKDVLARLLAYAKAHNQAVGAHIDGIDYFTHPADVTAHDLAYWGKCERVYGDPEKLLALPVRTLVYAGNEAGAEKMRQAIPELKVLMFSANTGADIVEKGYSKADGIHALCRHFSIDPKNTYAFGDSHNDLEMLQTVHTGIAMGNAIEEIKQAADYVTAPIDQDGIYKACRHFELI